MLDNVVEQGIVSAGHADMLKNGADWIYDVFSKVDMSSKDSAVESYKALSGEIDAAIRRFTDQYTGGAPKNETIRSEVDSYFYNLMEIKSVDTLA